MQPNQQLPPPPVLAKPDAVKPSGKSLAEEMANKKDLKPTETKVPWVGISLNGIQVTTLAEMGVDLGSTIDNANNQGKLGFRDDEDPTEYFDLPEDFRKKVDNALNCTDSTGRRSG